MTTTAPRIENARAHILALIPARSGSKSIPDKNLVPFRGKPLMAHSILQALASRFVQRVIVSTDSERYAEVARSFGAETPFLRPLEFASDNARDFGVFDHALEWLRVNEGYIPDVVVHLRPTYPMRSAEDIDGAVQMLVAHPGADSVRSVCLTPVTPYKMWKKGEDGRLKPLLHDAGEEAYNAPRQELPLVYAQNACIDVVWTRTILEKRSMSGDVIYPYEMNHFYDIDDVFTLEQSLTAAPASLSGLTFAFDIDGVLASTTHDMNYANAGPMEANIALVNALYERGNIIRLYTARGSATGIDWGEVTRGQMERWGLKYHELYFGKPSADFYIDDRMVGISAISRWIVEGDRGK